MNQPTNPFDYSQLSAPLAHLARGAAGRIKSRAKPTAQAAVEIGLDLQEVKAALPHGQWGTWLQSEFGWSNRTARRYIKIAEMFKTDNLSDLNISLSALHLLASADDETRETALGLARENGGLTHDDARALLSPPQQDPGDEQIFTAATAVVTRTRKIEITDEVKAMMEMASDNRAADMEIVQWGQAHQPPLPEMPKALAKPIYINPPVSTPPDLVRAMDQLNHIYKIKTGRYYYQPA